MRILHILTPLSSQTPAALLEEGIVTIGDLVADFCRFPCIVHEISADQTCLDITASLFTIPDYWAVARRWLIQFTQQTDLQDSLALGGYSFWWTHNSRKFEPVLSDLGNSFAWIDLLDAICKKVRPDHIVIYGQHAAIVHLVDQIYKEVDTQIRIESAVQEREKTRRHRKIGLLVARVLVGIVYLIYSILRHPDVCFFSGTNLLRSTVVGSKQKLRDVYLGDVAHRLQERGWRIAVVERHGLNASWNGLVARGFYFPNDIFFLLSMPDLCKVGLHRRIVRKWHKRWKDIQPRLISHLHYQGYDITPLALPLIAREFCHNAPGLEVMIRMWRYVLIIWRPLLLYVNDSYGRSAIPAIIAAKSLNISTVEQQHGVIGRNHSAYLVPRHLKTKSEFPLCDAMIVWGEHTKRLLVDADVYKPEQVAVCGFPRVDLLFGELPSRSKTLTQLGIPTDRQVILYASNMIAQEFVPEILDSIQGVPDSAKVYWVIKLHPREETRQIWETGIRQRQLQEIKVVKDELDFYALLAACAIHVSFVSTTLIEAAILSKLNLGLEVVHVPDPVGFSDAKAFLPVVPNQLGTVVCKLLHDPIQREELLREQMMFANDWCLHDGHAVDRIVRLVEAMIADDQAHGTLAG